MYNKSREKIGAKPPTPIKMGTTINRLPSKITENVLPVIKIRKDPIAQKPTSLSKNTNKTSELSHKGSSKKIESSFGSKKNMAKEKIHT
jgi:hypothetical protein